MIIDDLVQAVIDERIQSVFDSLLKLLFLFHLTAVRIVLLVSQTKKQLLLVQML